MKESENTDRKPMSFPLTVIVAMLSVKLAESEFKKFKAALHDDSLDDKNAFVSAGNGELCDKDRFLSKLPQLKKNILVMGRNFDQYEQNAYHWDKYRRDKCAEIDEIHENIVDIAADLNNETERMFCALKTIFDDAGCVFTNSIARCCNLLSLLRLNKSSIDAFLRDGKPTFRQEGTLRLLNSQQLNTYGDRIREMIFTPEDVDVMDSAMTQNCIGTFSNALMQQYKKHFIAKNKEVKNETV